MAPRILILDSDLRLLRMLSERLAYAGYDVATASRVHDAVLKGIVVCPDLLVCDILMPELSGCEVRRLLTQIPSLASMPIVFLSTQDILPSELYQPTIATVAVLKKPCDGDALAAAVAAVLARQTARLRLLDHPLAGHLPMEGATLVDLCQVLALRAIDGMVRISSDQMTAEWVWARGILIEASIGDLTGDAAFYRTVTAEMTAPAVLIEPPPAVLPRTSITKPLALLLSEALRQQRDQRDGRGPSPDLPAEEVNSENAFLERLAATGLITRTGAPTAGR